MAGIATISREAYIALSYGQRLTWFTRNRYDVPTPEANGFTVPTPKADGFTPTKIATETFMDITVASLDKTDRDIFDDSTRSLATKLMIGELSYEELVFVMVDSCVACDTDINKIIDMTRKKFPGCYPVLVKTSVNMAENGYKLTNAWKYPGVNLELLRSTLGVFNNEGDVNEDMGHGEEVGMYAFPISEEFAIVDKAIGNLLSTKGRWEEGDRQEINDNVQLEVLLAIHHRMFFCRIVMFTHDNKMKTKIEDAKASRPRVFIGTRDRIY